MKAEKESKEEENLELQNQLLIDRINLQNDSYYRQQMLGQLERIAKALEESLKPEEESEEK